jgi:hypothetical protein
MLWGLHYQARILSIGIGNVPAVVMYSPRSVKKMNRYRFPAYQILDRIN